MTAMGIVSTGTWFPETYVTAEEIAAQSGMPEWVVREKLGIERKFVADPEVHPNDMAVKAARKAIDKAGIDLQLRISIDGTPKIQGALDFAAAQRRARLLAKSLLFRPQVVR